MRLYPIYHPAAALYTPRMLETLREDFTRLPELLALGAPEQPPPRQVPDLVEEPEPSRGERVDAANRRGRQRSASRSSTSWACSRRISS